MLQKIVNWLCDVVTNSREYDCPKCNGKGRYKRKYIETTRFSKCVSWNQVVICEKCKGTGHLNRRRFWILLKLE